MATYPIGVTKSLATWSAQRNHVERTMDNASIDAAHPDDTLILAGPARRSVMRSDRSSPYQLSALGQFVSFSVNSNAPWTPMMAIGSGRSYFLRGKSQSSWNLQRVRLNGRSLLRALYHTATEVAGLNPDRFDDPAALEGSPNSLDFVNLDSELFYIPIGLAIVMRTKSHTLVSSCYLELCVVASWGLQIGAGQSMVSEQVAGYCDRIMPFQASDAMEVPGVGRTLMDAVLGLAPNVFPAPSYTRVASADNSGYGDSTVAAL